MASSNPSNFANLPKDELKEIAAKGGHASHGSGNNQVSHHLTPSQAQHLTRLSVIHLNLHRQQRHI